MSSYSFSVGLDVRSLWDHVSLGGEHRGQDSSSMPQGPPLQALLAANSRRDREKLEIPFQPSLAAPELQVMGKRSRDLTCLSASNRLCYSSCEQMSFLTPPVSLFLLLQDLIMALFRPECSLGLAVDVRLLFVSFCSAISTVTQTSEVGSAYGKFIMFPPQSKRYQS